MKDLHAADISGEEWLNSVDFSDEIKTDAHLLDSNIEERWEVRIPLISTSMEGHGLAQHIYELGDGVVLEYASDGMRFVDSYLEYKLASLVTIFGI